MKIKFKFDKTYCDNFMFFNFIPAFIISKDKEEPLVTSIVFQWLAWAFVIQCIKRTPKPKMYVICTQPIAGYLTKNKEYEVIKTISLSYLIKRDDDSIDRNARTRFGTPYMK
jgi:hypothetical protein